ncbi:MAG: hypothetical protein JWR45_1543 [Blastococcus sp.]|jgi:hypothetical protein|nr:hypothetical protein [Blastococcus sp.]
MVAVSSGRTTISGVGRLIAVLLFIAVLVPGVLLARAWWLAAGRRAVAGVGVELAEPTADGVRTLQRQLQHGRRIRRLGLVLGVAGIVGSVVLFAEASVFLWIPVLVVALLAGVLLAEATRPRPRWRPSDPVRRPRQAELISGWLIWTMRVAVAVEVAAAIVLWRTGEFSDAVGWAASVVPVLAWLLAEIALLRALVRPLPAEGSDVPVDEALRTWTAHLVTAAASVLALLPLGLLLLAAGIDPDRATQGFGFLPVALVAGGFSALAAGIAVAGFLLTWLRPVRSSARALAG